MKKGNQRQEKNGKMVRQACERLEEGRKRRGECGVRKLKWNTKYRVLGQGEHKETH